jgi:2-polyprenyl-6-methoxyphenol hydroxylase-like FAD-dependent oxidoreductase
MTTAPGFAPPPQVVVVGAGPVGLTLAIDLGRRGVRCLVVERNTAARHLPKMERANPRTMEIYRRLGLADAIRAAGMPGHVPMDVYVVSRLCDPPILRMPYPSPNDAKARTANVRDGFSPLEGNQIISQYTLEPILRAAAEALPTVTVRFDCALTSFEQDDTGVTVHLERADGTGETVRADYLAGCDGGTSTVRKQLGIGLHGRGSIGTLYQVFFRSDDLVEKVPRAGMARHFFVADTDARMIGTLVVVQDDQRHFAFHTALEEDADMVSAIRHVVGVPVQVEVLAITSWKLHLLLAGSYGQGRVLLVGDAAHLVIPMGALGLNTGVADAVDLSWKLAAALAGWGGPELVPSYAHERRLVGERVLEASEYAAKGTATWRKASTPAVFEDTPEGRQVREAVARLADVEQRKGQEMLGVELGYRYLGSPVICYDPGPQPAGHGYAYEPVSCPELGCRTRGPTSRSRSTTSAGTASPCSVWAGPLPTPASSRTRWQPSASRCRCSTCPRRTCARCTAPICSCCARTCTWRGAGTSPRPVRPRWRQRSPAGPGTRRPDAAGGYCPMPLRWLQACQALVTSGSSSILPARSTSPLDRYLTSPMVIACICSRTLCSR